jgi:pseudouridine-5'-monophosphatase
MDDTKLRALKTMLFGRSLADTIEALCHEIGTPPVNILEFRAFQDQYLKDLLPNAPLLPGAERLIRHLASNYIPIAVATSAPLCYFDLKITRYQNLFQLFNAIVTSDDVSACKPAPDLFLEAARQLGVEPCACLVLEDAPSGIKAAKAAGMMAVAVPPAGVHLSLYKQANIILDSLENLDLEWLGFQPLPELKASSS